MRTARAMIVATISLVAALAAAAAASIIGLERLSERDIGFDVHFLSLASRIENSTSNRLPMSFDGRDAATLLSELDHLGVAAATASPIDRIDTIQGSHRFEGKPSQFLFGVNFVSPNYFDVLGLRADSRCGLFRAFAPNQALMNTAFLRQFRLQPSTTATGLQLSAPGLNSDVMYCGVVPDAQFDDVRADPRPTIYLPLKRLGDLRSLIAPRDALQAHDTAIRTLLRNLAAGVEFKPWQSTQERIAEQLSDEQSLSRAGLLALAVALVLGVAICAFAVLSVAELLARSLAIRSAIGAPRWRLLLLLFVPDRMRTRMAVALLIFIICAATLKRFALEIPDLGISLICAFAAATVCIAAGIFFVMCGITEDRLRDWLANRS